MGEEKREKVKSSESDEHQAMCIYSQIKKIQAVAQAEEVRFELTRPLRVQVFQTCAIGH